MLIRRDRTTILIWLTICTLLVAAMVAIGGYTRLSGSGLSITEWKPIHGVLPPLNDAQWAEEFAAYRQSPQYLKVNSGMTLADFQTIFWPEYLHRLLARAIGLVFFMPLLIFAARRSISRRFFWRLAGIFALGGLQGLIGWLMVASGLVDTPAVSPVRLALHLAVALLILALLLWAAMDVLSSPSPCRGEGRGGGKSARSESATSPHPNPPPCRGRGLYLIWLTLLSLQILLGALVAGLHAGLIYNTWPSMNGHFLPDAPDAPAIAQFLHRQTAILVAPAFGFWWYLCRAYVTHRQLNRHCAAIMAVIIAQFALGVATLLHQAPLNLAWAHQMTALLLFTLAVITLYRLWQGGGWQGGEETLPRHLTTTPPRHS